MSAMFKIFKVAAPNVISANPLMLGSRGYDRSSPGFSRTSHAQPIFAMFNMFKIAAPNRISEHPVQVRQLDQIRRRLFRASHP